MYIEVTRQELDLLQSRIANSPEEARPALQAQLETLIHALAQSEQEAVEGQSDGDAEVEALFDNLPV